MVRFTIQTGNTLPVFIPSVVIGQHDPNLTIYSVSLQYSYQNIVYTITQNVFYQPEDATAPIPDPPLLSQDFSSKYYNLYNYTHLVVDEHRISDNIHGPMYKSARG
ncbi:MAG: phage minor capsid protein [Candidatus Fonsibacter sp.]